MQNGYPGLDEDPKKEPYAEHIAAYGKAMEFTF